MDTIRSSTASNIPTQVCHYLSGPWHKILVMETSHYLHIRIAEKLSLHMITWTVFALNQ